MTNRARGSRSTVIRRTSVVTSFLVRVATFARIREIVGAGALERRVPVGARAEDVWRGLTAEFPLLAALRASTRLVLNGAVATAQSLSTRATNSRCFRPSAAGRCAEVLAIAPNSIASVRLGAAQYK